MRRGFRIWPNYLVVLALYFCFPVLSERVSLPPLWRFLTFTQNFGLDYRTEGEFSHAWSLCVEEHFYLVFPLLAIWMARRFTVARSVVAFCFVFFGGMILRSLLWPSTFGENALFYRLIYYPTYCRLDGLMVGVSLAAVYRLKPAIWDALSRFANLSLGLGLLGVVLTYELCLEHTSWPASVFAFPSLALSFGALVFAAVAKRGWFSRVRIPFVNITATLAFAFYLTHKSAMHFAKGWIEGLGVSGNSVLYPLGIFGFCLAVSVVLYLLVERPFLKLRDRVSRAG